MAIDQATWRRTRKLGLTAHNSEKAFPGYTLYTPMFGDGTAYLLDMEGNEVHSWDLPLPPGDYGYLLPTGTLFYNAKTPGQPGEFFPTFPTCSGGAMTARDSHGSGGTAHRDAALRATSPPSARSLRTRRPARPPRHADHPRTRNPWCIPCPRSRPS